jgi:hypothetical protein
MEVTDLIRSHFATVSDQEIRQTLDDVGAEYLSQIDDHPAPEPIEVGISVKDVRAWIDSFVYQDIMSGWMIYPDYDQLNLALECSEKGLAAFVRRRRDTVHTSKDGRQLDWYLGTESDPHPRLVPGCCLVEGDVVQLYGFETVEDGSVFVVEIGNTYDPVLKCWTSVKLKGFPHYVFTHKLGTRINILC